jgi:protease I
MTPVLNGLHIAVFADEGFEPALLLNANNALQREGAITKVVASRRRPIDPLPGASVPAQDVDIPTAEADAKDFDAALVLGGAQGADLDHAKLAAFLADMRADDKPIGAIFKGVAVCADAGVVAGRRIAADALQAPAVASAGGMPVDEAVVTDGNLVTGRGAEDVDAFLACAIDAIRLKFRAGTAGTPDLTAVGLAAS